MRQHIKILGILNIVGGTMAAAVGLVVLVIMGTVAGAVAFGGAQSNAADAADAKIAAPIVGAVGLAIAVFFLALALPAIIGGVGLLKYKSWSRVLMFIVSALHLPNVPIGTALGGYGLWVLANEETRQLLESGGTIPAPPAFQMHQQPASYSQPYPPQ